ncbi:MAG: hypothetical protein L0Y66_07400 [Myxococcaceae bacterium]|nr:hypothetical protein [Myxococcaceae bacterium]MCI0670529.1 hypothetical protein [Myxococcaceae bacterium]
MTRADAQMRTLVESLPQGSLRHTILTSARRFKATWVELGKLLVQVRDEARYEEWGYPSFEAYCLKELHIRKPTALKLTRSFSFLDRHEPEEVRRQDVGERAPAFEVVEVLADAEERGQLTAEEYQELRESIWNPEKPTVSLRREFNERFPRPSPPPPAGEVRMRRFAQAARRLAGELSASGAVPPAVSERAAALAEDLEELAAAAATRA